MRALIGAELITPNQEESMLRALNKEQFAAVQVPGGEKVLITRHGELPGGFIDPASKQLLIIDHTKLACIAVQKLPDSQLLELQGVAKFRDPIDVAMRAQAAEWLPSAVVTTYGASSSGIKVRPAPHFGRDSGARTGPFYPCSFADHLLCSRSGVGPCKLLCRPVVGGVDTDVGRG